MEGARANYAADIIPHRLFNNANNIPEIEMACTLRCLRFLLINRPKKGRRDLPPELPFESTNSEL